MSSSRQRWHHYPIEQVGSQRQDLYRMRAREELLANVRGGGCVGAEGWLMDESWGWCCAMSLDAVVSILK